ncbi:hypothetical protein EUX98_g2756 [Antrodiella citrinella]|uniref:HpcH/HpaI aldolase/citrate lyase domain-containing protein n=1 Tax=Antrodiella citrinella TaxID=2447956 RepID=A0A4V6S1W8_9APHY|nr:hypothetical protein EUX98_g2756 [Antrodiella citrinella]
MTSHPLLTAFKASKPAFGAWVTIPGIWAARTAAGASPHLSWLVIDCEHGLTPLQPGAAESIAAISGLGPNAPSTIVRIPATGACADGSATWQIKYVLDAGAKGVLVPMISTAAQAKSIVKAARFPPQGNRGFGSPFTQASWGISATDYLANANDSVLVLDGIFIGPYDLSLSFEHPAPNPDPVAPIEEKIQAILQAAHKAGKKCAIYCSSGEQAAQRAAQGFDMINVTSDSGAMSEGIARSLAIATGQSVRKEFGY